MIKRLTCTLVTLAMLMISFLGLAPVSAQTSDRPDGMRFVPDVPGQFRALTERADALGIYKGGSPNPSSCKHYQAMTRVDGADGTPFFLVTRSGNLPDALPGIACDDSPNETGNGHLIVFRMGSRDKNGERMRSNRLRKGVDVDHSTPPDPEDKATIYFTVASGGLVFQDGEGTPPPGVYQHPGGMALVGHMLALAVEAPRESGIDTLIMFFDVSDPEAPVFRSQSAPKDRHGVTLRKAGVVAVTPLPGGLYLMAVAGGANDTLFFYRSTVDNLANPELSWNFFGTTPGPGVVSGDEDAHQTLQFLREGDINGPLYLAGARGDADPRHGGDQDRLDLYRVRGCETPNCVPGDLCLTVLSHGQRITPFPNTGGNRLANLAAGSGFHVTPSGELIFYATQHDNDGPSGTVTVGEWRHEDMVREGSPTYLPTAVVNGPYEVDEGSSVSLSGSAKPPITKAWIQLFQAVNFGSLYPVVDFDDYDLDDFDDFRELGPPHVNLTQARSWSWFAPVGCSILAIDHQLLHPDVIDETRTLVGDGFVHHDPDLSMVLNDGGTDDIDQEVDAVDFLQDCHQYYATPFVLQWDLDRDGSYETTGTLVTFNAAALDGPSEVDVPVQARHPSGGPTGQTTARVIVRNVAPQLTQFRVTDSAGRQVNVAVPFVLTGLPVTVGAGFTDPGVLDHQSAALAWGDGSVDPQTAFTTFDEAFGDGNGAVTHTHRYALAGSYPIALSVTDDDGGADTEATVVRVVTPEQAVEEIIGLLDSAIASTTNNNVRSDLEKARKALAGSNGVSNNGALDMIRAGNDQAAIAFLQEAIFRLRQAQAGGANVGTQIALLEQVVAALSAA
jgi:PKD domain